MDSGMAVQVPVVVVPAGISTIMIVLLTPQLFTSVQVQRDGVKTCKCLHSCRKSEDLNTVLSKKNPKLTISSCFLLHDFESLHISEQKTQQRSFNLRSTQLTVWAVSRKALGLSTEGCVALPHSRFVAEVENLVGASRWQ